ncbi:hypothetical protein DTO012A7_1006 [Penicillium roqueforti]|nr:hypothetical protein CBS147372_3776 [Penicillium roqueforti]KAI3245027.1 hypothetical protein DTO012A7_1006 [Penicillium roqueforti]KAI3276939.1 hypothetical protein CBS147309_2921 [Penicillium roqueforti]
MPNVNEDIGYTVLHFLYTGGYETVSSPLDEGVSDLAREYKRSVLVYYALRTWGLTDLEILAKQKMEHLDKDLPILEILRVVRDVFSRLPADETWLPSYIRGNLQRLPKPEVAGLDLHAFYNILGQDHQFDNAVMKMILEMLSISLCSMKDQHAKILNGIISEESPLRGPSPEDPEPVPEEPEPEPIFEEAVPEPAFEEAVPEPAFEEAVPEPAFEEAVPEPAFEEAVLEPVFEEPEPEPIFEAAVPEPVFEEPEPEPAFEEAVPEPAFEEAVPEPVVESPEPEPELEPVLEESPAEGGSEQWIIPQVSADTDSWSRASLSPGDTSNTEILPEATDQGYIARISWSDLSLYGNWANMSSKKRAKRASKLRSRGLPVPSETGFISIVAD